MQKTNSKKGEWKRHKEVTVPWAQYDAYRDNEYKYVIDLRNLFLELDIPIQRREFLLSNLTILILLKIMFGISYRGIASATKNLGIYKILGMKRAPSYKTIQRTIQYLHFDFLLQVNRVLTPFKIQLAGIDSSGMKTNCKGVWVQIRFKKTCSEKRFQEDPYLCRPGIKEDTFLHSHQRIILRFSTVETYFTTMQMAKSRYHSR